MRVVVRSRDGWCRALYKKTLRYQDTVRTVCGYVILPWGIERLGKNHPVTCADCRVNRRVKEIQDGE